MLNPIFIGRCSILLDYFSETKAMKPNKYTDISFMFKRESYEIDSVLIKSSDQYIAFIFTNEDEAIQIMNHLRYGRTKTIVFTIADTLFKAHDCELYSLSNYTDNSTVTIAYDWLTSEKA